MAWFVSGTNLSIAEEDFGIGEVCTISGVTLDAADTLKFTFKDTMNGEEILSKEFTNISENQVVIQFTEEESAMFPVGSYVYRLDWYRNGQFMCNIIPYSTFRVVDKA